MHASERSVSFFARPGALPMAILFFDGLMAFLALFIALYVRIGDEFLDYTPTFILKNMVVFALVNISVFSWMQTHKVLWRYMSLEDIVPLALAALLGSVLFFPLMVLLGQQESLPRSMPILNVLVLLFLLCFPRFIYRFIHDYHIKQKRRERGIISIPALLIGQEDTAEAFLRSMLHSPDVPYTALGVVTPVPQDQGRAIHGVPILGSIDALDLIIRNLTADVTLPRYLIVTEAKLTPDERYIIAEAARAYGLNVMHMLHFFAYPHGEEDEHGNPQAA
jgi:O-antigen biosynthesis protein WbqV